MTDKDTKPKAPVELKEAELDKVAGGGVDLVNATVGGIRSESLNNTQHEASQAKAPPTVSLSMGYEEIKVKY